MKSHYQKKCLAVFSAVAVLAAPAAFATATSVEFDFGPAGSPMMTALFQNVAPGQFQLTIGAINLGSGSTLNSLCFNLNPIFDAKNLSFTQTGSVGGVQGTVGLGNDCYKVSGGSGKFDINFVFGPDFVTGDSLTYSITGISGLTVNDFLFQETASAGHLPGYAAGAIQQPSGLLIVEGSPLASNNAAVPDISSTFGLMATGLLGIGVLARRYKRTAKSV